MNHGEALVARCGRCGRLVRLPFARLLGLKIFDCRRRRRLSHGERNSDTHHAAIPTADGVAETAVRLVEILEDLNGEERSMLVRWAVGFSDRELVEVYGRLVDLEDLVIRVVARVRSNGRCPENRGQS